MAGAANRNLFPIALYSQLPAFERFTNCKALECRSSSPQNEKSMAEWDSIHRSEMVSLGEGVSPESLTLPHLSLTFSGSVSCHTTDCNRTVS